MDGRDDRPQGELIMRRAFEDSLSLLAGVGVGTALMYLLDPDNGADRRERVAQGTREAFNNAGDTMSDASHRIAKSARSAWSELGSNLNDHYDDSADSINRYADHLKSAAMSGASQYSPNFSRMRRRFNSAIQDARERLANRVSGKGNDYSDYIAPVAGYTAGGLALVALGAGCAYLFDPDRGRARRTYLMDKSNSMLSEAGQFMRRTGKHLSNKMYGTAMEATRPLRKMREQREGEGLSESSCPTGDAPTAM